MSPQSIQRIAPTAAGQQGTPPRLALGVAAADAWLGGGLQSDGLHEAHAASPEDIASAIGFALLVANLQRRRSSCDSIIWVREAAALRPAGQLYAPGLLELGINPEILTLLFLADSQAVLRAGLDSVRAGGVGAVVLELHGKQSRLDLTASRRLTLAAAQTATLVLLVRCNPGTAPTPSAAHSRWQVASAASCPLEANAPGKPAFDLTLLRQRGGRDGLHIVLEWDCESACFREPTGSRRTTAPLSGATAAMAERPADDPRRVRAA